MGWLKTIWEAEFEGHKLVVRRNEIGRGFKLEWDGEVVAQRRWSMVGLGELHGSVEIEGQPVEVKVAITWGGIDGTCTITVGDAEIPVRKIK